MAATAVSGCIFQWKIENVFHWWWLKNESGIASPVFIAEKLGKTKWTLWFYPIETNENGVGIYLRREKDCDGPAEIEVTCQFAFLSRGGLILKETTEMKSKFSKGANFGRVFDERERIFITDRERFLAVGTLEVQCTVWITDQKPPTSNRLLATTIIKVKRRYFEWRIDNICKLDESDIKNKFGDHLIACNVLLRKNLEELRINVFDWNESVRHISSKISVIGSKGRKVYCESQNCFANYLRRVPLDFIFTFPLKALEENGGNFFPNQSLSLGFEFVLLTIKLSECRDNSVKFENEVVRSGNFQNTATLSDDLYPLYVEGCFSDMLLRTPTKSFPAHKLILSARSLVFKSMFSTNMRENNTGQVDITDFEEDTIKRMLLYMYTDSLKDLQMESAIKLYKAADKYQILSLKSKCSSFIIENLCPTDACDVLVLADLHSDDDLMKDVQNYIRRRRKQIFCSQEWKNLMRTDVKSAAAIMHTTLSFKSNF